MFNNAAATFCIVLASYFELLYFKYSKAKYNISVFFIFFHIFILLINKNSCIPFHYNSFSKVINRMKFRKLHD